MLLHGFLQTCRFGFIFQHLLGHFCPFNIDLLQLCFIFLLFCLDLCGLTHCRQNIIIAVCDLLLCRCDLSGGLCETLLHFILFLTDPGKAFVKGILLLLVACLFFLRLIHGFLQIFQPFFIMLLILAGAPDLLLKHPDITFLLI